MNTWLFKFETRKGVIPNSPITIDKLKYFVRSFGMINESFIIKSVHNYMDKENKFFFGFIETSDGTLYSTDGIYVDSWFILDLEGVDLSKYDYPSDELIGKSYEEYKDYIYEYPQIMYGVFKLDDEIVKDIVINYLIRELNIECIDRYIDSPLSDSIFVSKDKNFIVIDEGDGECVIIFKSYVNIWTDEVDEELLVITYLSSRKSSKCYAPYTKQLAEFIKKG